MKTIEEKAKAYDEALERAKVAHKDTDRHIKATIERIFPDLKESEDERIIEEIKFAVMQMPSERQNTKDRCLVWLKKQKEKLDYLSVNRIKIRPDGGIERHTIGYLEKQKEQKELPLMDGNADLYFDEWNQQKQNPTKRQCFEEGIRYAQRLQKEQKPDIEICPHSIKSKSYRENGVPTESISDELIDIIKGEFEGFRRLLKKKGIDYEPQNGYWEGFARLFDSSAREYVKETAKDCLAQIKFRSVEEARKACEPDYVILKKEDYERLQKPAWSKEDEENIGKLHRLLVICQGEKKFIPTSEYDKLDNWLQRLRPQPKQGKKGLILTEEQEKEFGHLFTHPSWKPSEDQMAVLLNAEVLMRANKYKENAKILAELYKELKKLM